jgi:hypothetical protein
MLTMLSPALHFCVSEETVALKRDELTVAAVSHPFTPPQPSTVRFGPANYRCSNRGVFNNVILAVAKLYV